MLIRTLVAMLALVSLFGCEKPAAPQAPVDMAAVSPDPAHNSRLALDWSGYYQGVLPCADCEGIDTQLWLHQDGQYQLKLKYLGRDEQLFELAGRFEWLSDGNRIQLHTDNAEIWLWRVEEEGIRQLDQQGELITGPLQQQYRISKQAEPAGESLLSGTRWQLTELMGAAVAADSGIFIQFTADGRVHGYNGCNNFMGGYQQQGLSLSLSQLASTMKACADASYESEFMQVLQTADNISLAAEVLSLNKARMAPLARFLAVAPSE
ncbi:copper resistance protein NlpE N-terminal domain-containing protein [Arsukibacterium sp.]|uniref:copper resistance protein NlpE N-terminal domain-containing protein n=1 Tax=Arsukibacterium sp. TaxID=1977258 RepID=UPI002FDB4196